MARTGSSSLYRDKQVCTACKQLLKDVIDDLDKIAAGRGGWERFSTVRSLLWDSPGTPPHHRSSFSGQAKADVASRRRPAGSRQAAQRLRAVAADF